MSNHATPAGPPARPELALVRSGQDWARWLDQAHTARPFSPQWHATGRLTMAWTALVQLARREGFAAALGDCADGDAFTSWADRRIHVRRGASPEQALIALTHQLGHVLLHGAVAYLNRSGTLACGGIRGAEADSVAYLVATHVGIDTAGVTFAPPSSWAGTPPRDNPIQTMQAVTDRVLAAAAEITGQLDAVIGPAPASGDPARTTCTAERDQASPVSRDLSPAGGARTDGGRGGHTGTGVQHPGQGATASPPGEDVAARAAGPGTPDTHGQLVRVHQAAARFFRGRLASSWVPGYLAGRGFSPATVAYWQAGYAPAAWDALTRHLRALGYPATVLEAAGLAHRSWRGTIDTFRDRAMLPIHDSHGTVAGFIGRAPNSAGPDVPRYLNSPGTALYRKSAVLFGLWQARPLLAHGARPVITEGPFDAIAVTAAGGGRFAGVAPCGTALTGEQIAALGWFCDLATTGVIVAFDPDQAGRKAAVAAYHLLAGVTAEPTAAVLPAGQDPAEILRDHGPAGLACALAGNTRPLADLFVDAEVDGWSRWLTYPEGQFNALRATAPLVAAMPPAHVARQVARLAHRLGLDYATVTQAVTDALPHAIARAAPHPHRRKR